MSNIAVTHSFHLLCNFYFNILIVKTQVILKK
nr:MAG TPA: hypothetical protein [Bacteriophage sp.]